MSKFDLKNDIKVLINKAPTAISSNTTTDGVSVDTRDYGSLTFAFVSATLTDGVYTPVIEESDTGAFAGEENEVADDDLIGLESAAAFVAADDSTVKTIGYRGNKRYVRPTIVSTSVTTGGTMGIQTILGNPKIKPVV